MNLLQSYYKKIIKYDLLNKFKYNTLKEIPELKKIILNFGCKSFEIKKIATAMLALELITTEKSLITKSSNSNIKLKIRKGHPVGCIVVLKKEKMYSFLQKLLSEIFPKLKDFKGLVLKKENNKSFSFTIKDLIVFNELESHFYLFSNLPALNLTIVVKTNTFQELKYLLKSLKLPIKK